VCGDAAAAGVLLLSSAEKHVDLGILRDPSDVHVQTDVQALGRFDVACKSINVGGGLVAVLVKETFDTDSVSGDRGCSLRDGSGCAEGGGGLYDLDGGNCETRRSTASAAGS